MYYRPSSVQELLSELIKRLLHNFGMYLTQMAKNGKTNYISLSNCFRVYNQRREEKRKIKQLTIDSNKKSSNLNISETHICYGHPV